MGSNLGFRFDNVRTALRLMAKTALKDMRVSCIFETKALLPPGAPDSWDLPYFNLVAVGTSTLTPHNLQKQLQAIEQELGRNFQAPRWAPRVIDLDILAWGDTVIADKTLQIPHPELMNRPFLLRLMASLGTSWRYPISGFPYSHLTLTEILTRFSPNGEMHKCFMPFPQIMGIVNITPDSFSDGGKYLQAEKALERIQELAKDGSSIIDLGAQSTRPGATPISAEEEWQRLEPVLDLLRQTFQRCSANPKISLDTFYPEVIEKALRHFPVDWINDVEGGKNERLLQTVADSPCKIVLTHSLTVPASPSHILPFDKTPSAYLCEWAERKIHQLNALGISQERIILDPGIGFGKSPYQSLELLRNIDALKTFGCEVLVGQSRKSFLKTVTLAADRDIETIGISHHLLKKKIDYLRVHNVDAHQRSFTALAFVEGIDV